jgi:hypothetical protein
MIDYRFAKIVVVIMADAEIQFLSISGGTQQRPSIKAKEDGHLAAF